ncbi:MAG: NAD-dependent epimerase/dehydratase family protein [Acidimicrobiales bacterium]
MSRPARDEEPPARITSHSSPPAKRVLITGLASFWGGRLAQAVEQHPEIETVVGVDVDVPTVPLQRTEFVRADHSYSILSRIVSATQVDTILHTSLVVDPTRMRPRQLHELNVIGTLNLLAAAAAPGSSVTRIVLKSSTLVYGAGRSAPEWFGESSPRTGRPVTATERSLAEAEGYLQDFIEDNPATAVTLLRYSNVLGPGITTPLGRLLSGPVIPCIFGFDPLLQFVEESDVVRSLEFALDHHLHGTYNVSGDYKIPWSEVAAIVGKPLLPLPPVLTGIAAAIADWAAGMDLVPEIMALLRYGRGVDNTRLKRAGFAYRYTTPGAIEAFARERRLRSVVGDPEPGFRYEPDTERFFRDSPAVVRDARA